MPLCVGKQQPQQKNKTITIYLLSICLLWATIIITTTTKNKQSRTIYFMMNYEKKKGKVKSEQLEAK